MIDKISDVDYEIIEAPTIAMLRSKVRNYLLKEAGGGFAKRIEGGIVQDSDTEYDRYYQVIAISKIEYEAL